MEIIRHNEDAQKEFVSGIQSLECVVNVLNNANIDDSTSVFIVKEIARSLCSPIRQAHAHLTTCLKLWEQDNALLSEKIERSVAEMSGLRRSIFEKKCKVEELDKKLESLNHQIESKEEEQQKAQSSVSKAKDTLQDSEKKLEDVENEKKIDDDGRVKKTVLMTLAFGWIGLGISIWNHKALQKSVEVARETVKSAEDNARDCEKRLQAKRTEQDNLRQQLSGEKSERRETDLKLNGLEKKVEELLSQQRSLVEVHKKLKNTCHVMTTIWGKSGVLSGETRHAYSLEPLITPLREIAEMFTAEEQKKMMTTLLLKDVDFSHISLKLIAIREKHPDNSQAILDDKHEQLNSPMEAYLQLIGWFILAGLLLWYWRTNLFDFFS